MVSVQSVGPVQSLWFVHCNFINNKSKQLCVCGIEMNNIHLYECRTLNRDIKTHSYSKLFNGTLKEQKYIANILTKNEDKYNEFTNELTILRTS